MFVLTVPLWGKCVAFVLGIFFVIALYKSYVKAKKLVIKNNMLLKDIRFLLSVEDLHCRANIENGGSSERTNIRKAVVFERGITWSGKYTNSSIVRELAKNIVLNNELAPIDKFSKDTALSIIK
jgi:hypothetical protein